MENGEQIRRAEFGSIYGAPGMDIYVIRSVQPIHIIVNNGHQPKPTVAIASATMAGPEAPLCFLCFRSVCPIRVL